MPVTTSNRNPTYSAIFSRMIDANRDRMTSSTAKYILSLGFTDTDRDRMTDLAERNQDGDLDRDEKRELDEYVRAGHFLALLQLKARRAIKSRS